MKLPKLKKWPKGLKARLRKREAIDKRKSENKAIEKAIEAARKKLGR